MFSDNPVIIELVALLRAYGVKRVVLSPGSRNAPLIHSFVQCLDFQCYTIVDERSAGFFALGLSQCTKEPVVICCTSGTALLNYTPAVAEAYYQEIPLIVISADRPVSWIGQLDGQTIPQQNVFGTMIKKQVQLPENASGKENHWWCNRLINEALIELSASVKGPVHINVPLAEPLYNFTVKQLPPVRTISCAQQETVMSPDSFAERWLHCSKRMIVVGQMPPCKRLKSVIQQFTKRHDVVVVSEHISNVDTGSDLSLFDAALAAVSSDEMELFAPELLIVMGGHITSRRLKTLLRTYPAKEQWLVRPDRKVIDTYQSLTEIIPAEPVDFLEQLEQKLSQFSIYPDDYYNRWKRAEEKSKQIIQRYCSTLPFCDMKVISLFLATLPENSVLQLGNSSPIRYAQLFPINPLIPVFSNRGTNGIDGVVSTAVGYAAEFHSLTCLLVGDLSFFYDINGLWNRYLSSNLRILLLNNKGGNIFHLIDGPRKSDALNGFIACTHEYTAKQRIEGLGLIYLSAYTLDELIQQLPLLLNSEHTNQSIILEVFTDTEVNQKTYTELFHILKNN